MAILTATKHLESFEEICTLEKSFLKPVFERIDVDTFVKACAGTSPDNRAFISEVLNSEEFAEKSANRVPLRITEIEECQQRILDEINRN